MKKKDDITFAWGSSIHTDIVSHFREIQLHLEERTHWILGISVLIITIVLSNLSSFQHNKIAMSGAILILIGSLLSSVILFDIISITRNKKKNTSHGDTLFSHRNLINNYTIDKLSKALGNIRKDPKKIDEEFSKAIFHQSKSMNKDVRAISIASKILSFTLVVGIILIVVGFLSQPFPVDVVLNSGH